MHDGQIVFWLLVGALIAGVVVIAAAGEWMRISRRADRFEISRLTLIARINGEQVERQRKEITRLTGKLDEMTAYADQLAEGLPEGMLPKDVEILREANGRFAQQVFDLEAELKRANLELLAHGVEVD